MIMILLPILTGLREGNRRQGVVSSTWSDPQRGRQIEVGSTRTGPGSLTRFLFLAHATRRRHHMVRLSKSIWTLLEMEK